jgi:hypothetical protein
MQVGTASRLGGSFGYGQTTLEKALNSGIVPVPVIGQSALLGKESFRTLPLSVSGFNPFSESATAAVKRGDYEGRTGNAAFDTISPAAWEKYSPQFRNETFGFRNITDWRERRADGIKAQLVPQLGPDFLPNQLEDLIEETIKKNSPFYTVYSGVRDVNQINWISKNPDLALEKYEEGQQLINDNPGRADIAERAWKPSSAVRGWLRYQQIKNATPVAAP